MQNLHPLTKNYRLPQIPVFAIIKVAHLPTFAKLIHERIICINMRKNERKGNFYLLTSTAERVLVTGMLLILLALLCLSVQVAAAAPYSPATAEDFGRLLEYPVAALALLTALTFLLDRVVRAEKK